MGECNILLWDVGNVMLKPVHPDLLRSLFDRVDVRHDHVVLQAEVRRVLDDSFFGRICLEKTWQQLGDVLGLAPSYVAEVRSTMQVQRNEELIREIIRIAGEVRTGIVSDLSQIGYEVVKAHLGDVWGVCQEEDVFVSPLTGMTKVRDGERYLRYIMERLRLQPHQCVLIDDDLGTITTARSLGWVGIHYAKDPVEPEWKLPNRQLLMDLRACRV